MPNRNFKLGPIFDPLDSNKLDQINVTVTQSLLTITIPFPTLKFDREADEGSFRTVIAGGDRLYLRGQKDSFIAKAFPNTGGDTEISLTFVIDTKKPKDSS